MVELRAFGNWPDQETIGKAVGVLLDNLAALLHPERAVAGIEVRRRPGPAALRLHNLGPESLLGGRHHLLGVLRAPAIEVFLLLAGVAGVPLATVSASLLWRHAF